MGSRAPRSETAISLDSRTENETDEASVFLDVLERPATWKRFRQSPAAVAGLLFVVLYVLSASTAHWLPIQDPLEMQTEYAMQGPSAQYLMGTDQYGRDMFSRIIYGAQITLTVALSAVTLSLLIGTTTGLLTGFFGGTLDAVAMRVMDILFSFPPILLALAIVAALGHSNLNLVLAIATVYTPIFARMVRGPVLSIKEREYVEAARSLGARPGRIILRHILPNVMSPIVVQASLALSWATLTEASLSFVGLGTQPPLPSWGGMINESRSYMELAPWMAIAPGIALVIAVLGFNLLGDGLRDVLDPQL